MVMPNLNDVHIFSIGGSCKHVAALLYLLVRTVEAGGHLTCTEQAQAWHRPPKTKIHQPEFVKNIKIKKLKRNCLVEEVVNKKGRFSFDPRAPIHQTMGSIEDFDLHSLADITQGKAAILTTVAPKPHPKLFLDADVNIVHSEVVIPASAVGSIPPTIPEWAETILQSEPGITLAAFLKIISDLLCTIQRDDVHAVEGLTSLQADSGIWHKMRLGRITASVVKDAVMKVDQHGNIGR